MNKFGDLWSYVETVKPEIENALQENLPLAPASVSINFNEAFLYSKETPALPFCWRDEFTPKFSMKSNVRATMFSRAPLIRRKCKR